MKEKMQKLNKHLFPLVVAFVLFLGLCSPISASAAWDDPYEYTEFPYTVEYGSDFNYVYFTWSAKYTMWTICKMSEPNKIVSRSLNASGINFTFEAGESYIIRCYPFGTNGLTLDHIPNGTDIGFAGCFDVDSSTTYFDSVPSVEVLGWLKNRNDKTSPRESYETFTLANVSDPFSVVLSVDSEVLFSKVAADENSVYDRFIPMMSLSGFVASYSRDMTVDLSFSPTSFVMKVPSSYWVQFQNDILDSKLEVLSEDIENGFADMAAGFSDLKNYIAAQHDLTTDIVVAQANKVTGSLTAEIQSSKDIILSAIADSNNTLVNGTPEMDSIAQNSNQNLANSSDRLDALGDKLASVEKPNVEDIKPSSPEQIVSDPDAGLVLSAPITSMWDNPVIFGIITTVLTLVLLSWVFFGKK